MSTLTSLGYNFTARTDDLEKGAKKGSSIIKKFASSAVAVMATAGAAAGVALTASLVEALDQMDATSTLQAQLDLSSKSAAKYGKIAGKLYTSGVTDSFAEGTEAIKQMMQNGLADPSTTNKQLMSMATKATDLAKVFGQEVGPVSVAVAQMIKTGLVKNADEAFDLLTKGFQSGANKADDLLDTMNEYGTQFRKAGLTGKQAMNLISQGLQGGARDADIVADAIKEFSIRAVDGSKASAGGFKALGLNAKTMMAEFGKGGASANSVLDQTLDRLRNIKDPVKQSAIAVALFGTQAEDLGQALFKLDPSKAEQAMGGVAGAATRLGGTLRSGLRYEFTKFYRELNQKVVDFLIAKVIPALLSFAMFLKSDVIPVVKDIASTIASVLGPALKGLLTGVAATVKWFKDMATWLIPIGILLGGYAIALSVDAIAMGTLTAAFALNAFVVNAWATVTRIAAAAQWLFNAAISANPIVLIITLIVAFIAAIVVLYHRSETFRQIISAAWAGIKMAAFAAWNTVIKPIFAGFMVAMSALGAAGLWLWKNILSPVWTGISFVIKIAWWVIRVIFALMMAAFRGLAAVAVWLYNTILKPIFSAIGAVFKWMWNTAGRPIFDAMKLGFKVLGAVFRSTWDTVIRPVWNFIGNKVRDTWNKFIKPTFEGIKLGVQKVKDAFETCKAGIKVAWDKLREILKAPVRFFVMTVYNQGLRKAWNNTAGKIPGVPDMAEAHLPKGFARGGPISGPGNPNKDSVPIRAMPGEFMVRKSRVKKFGLGFMRWVNGDSPGFALGGLIPDPIKDIASSALGGVKKGFDWAKDFTRGIAGKALRGLFRPARALVNGITSRFSGSGIMGTFIKKFANSGFDRMEEFVKGKAKSDDAVNMGRVNIGGSGVQRWAPIVKQVLSMLHLSQSALGPVLTRIRMESGGNPNAINNWDVNAKNGDPSRGLMQTISSTFRAYAGPYRHRSIYDPLANIYAGINYARHRYGSNWVNVMTRPGGYAAGGLIQRMDSGGTVPRGLSVINNTTGAPERLKRVRGGGDGEGVHYHLHFHDPVIAGSAKAAEDLVVSGMRRAQDNGRIAKGTVKR